MAKKKSKKKVLYFSISRLIVFLVISAILCGAFFIFKNDIDKAINGKDILTSVDTLSHDGLLVHYIDVGQADCIAIEFPDGKKMLIDSGSTDSTKQMVSYINKNIFDQPDEEKVFDYVLLTHSDEDHCGGMPMIFEEYQVNNVFRPQIYINSEDMAKDSNSATNGLIKDTNIYRRTINAMYAEPNCNVFFTVMDLMNTTQKICANTSDNYYEFEFYSPTKNVYNNVNTYSPIMTLTYSGKVFMFTGDATTASETEALESNLPKVDVLKVGHHGSTTSSSQKFLNKILPTYAIIQVGKDNSYGHPKQEIVDRLTNIGARIYRTDINQNIVAVVDGSGSLMVVADIGNKINVIYFLLGAEIIIVYFSFFVPYKIKKQA